MEIKVHNNNVEQALKAFKQKLTKSGFIREMRERRFYEKPSEKKKRIKQENTKRAKKIQKMRNRI